MSDQSHNSQAPSPQLEDAYIAVVYGLIATDGLEKCIDVSSTTPWRYVPPYFLLFLGTIILGLHFWFTCSSIESPSTAFYGARANGAWANLFLLIDMLAATVFAGILLAMFRSISHASDAFFKGFIAVGAFSLVYDVYSWVLVSTTDPSHKTQPAVKGYLDVVRRWLIQDFIFLLCGVFVYYFRGESWSEYAFLFVAVGLLIVDVTNFSRPH